MDRNRSLSAPPAAPACSLALALVHLSRTRRALVNGQGQPSQDPRITQARGHIDIGQRLLERALNDNLPDFEGSGPLNFVGNQPGPLNDSGNQSGPFHFNGNQPGPLNFSGNQSGPFHFNGNRHDTIDIPLMSLRSQGQGTGAFQPQHFSTPQKSRSVPVPATRRPLTPPPGIQTSGQGIKGPTPPATGDPNTSGNQGTLTPVGNQKPLTSPPSSPPAALRIPLNPRNEQCFNHWPNLVCPHCGVGFETILNMSIIQFSEPEETEIKFRAQFLHYNQLVDDGLDLKCPQCRTQVDLQVDLVPGVGDRFRIMVTLAVPGLQPCSINRSLAGSPLSPGKRDLSGQQPPPANRSIARPPTPPPPANRSIPAQPPPSANRSIPAQPPPSANRSIPAQPPPPVNRPTSNQNLPPPGSRSMGQQPPAFRQWPPLPDEQDHITPEMNCPNCQKQFFAQLEINTTYINLEEVEVSFRPGLSEDGRTAKCPYCLTNATLQPIVAAGINDTFHVGINLVRITSSAGESGTAQWSPELIGLARMEEWLESEGPPPLQRRTPSEILRSIPDVPTVASVLRQMGLPSGDPC